MSKINSKKAKYIQIIDEGVTYDVISIADCADAIKEEYLRNDVCIGELMDNIEVVGFSIPEIIRIYAKVMKDIENDKLILVKENEEYIIE